MILSPIEQSIKKKIEAVGTPLKEWDINIYRGILTGCNEAFIISTEKRNEILENCSTPEERQRTDALIRPIRQGEYIELFKYFTKLLIKDKRGKRYIDFKRLDFIFQTIKGKRVYQPFGGLKKVEDSTDDKRILADDVPIDYLRIWRWMNYVGYVDEESGEVLTGDWVLPNWVQELTGIIPQNED